MKTAKPALLPETHIKETFASAGIDLASVERRDFPDESIFIVRVADYDFQRALDVGNTLDYDLQQAGFKGFVTIRKTEPISGGAPKPKAAGVSDPKATELISLLNARSRASELQPSLTYVPDTAFNIKSVVAPRHHLIFGRRGVGKTSLMVEAKRLVVGEGHAAVWVNLQSLRLESVSRAFCFICERICDAMQIFFKSRAIPPAIYAK